MLHICPFFLAGGYSLSETFPHVWGLPCLLKKSLIPFIKAENARTCFSGLNQDPPNRFTSLNTDRLIERGREFEESSQVKRAAAAFSIQKRTGGCWAAVWKDQSYCFWLQILFSVNDGVSTISEVQQPKAVPEGVALKSGSQAIL